MNIKEWENTESSPLNPQQKIDYLESQELAFIANGAFDIRLRYAKSMARMLQLDPELVSYNAFRNTAKNFSAADDNFNLLMNAATVLMPPRVAFDKDDKDLSPTDESILGKEPQYDEMISSESVWDAMNPEQRGRAIRLRAEMSRHFSWLGVSEETLRVIKLENSTFRIVHIGIGLDIGSTDKPDDKKRSYDEIWSKDNDRIFMFEVDGKKYDSRTGMNEATYKALYYDLQLSKLTLRDSPEFQKETHDEWTYTILTGEKPDETGLIKICLVEESGDCMVNNAIHRDVGSKYLRVRPAVAI